MERQRALFVIIKCNQKAHLGKEIQLIKQGKLTKSFLSGLNPFLDSNDILRVGGRLQNATLSYERKHPAILPKNSIITNLIIKREHLRLLHAGPRMVLSSLSQSFHIINGIREIKKVLYSCIICARLKAKAAEQLMGSLPPERVTSSRPFEIVGIDFCGPFQVKAARLRKSAITKGYIALYVCFTTKAIHLELCSNLTTENFLASLKRFISRRGMPTKIFCDNAKTFKGAANQLKALYDLQASAAHRNAVNFFCASNYITFKFIPSYSPEFGGLWEAGVKSAKFHLKRTVGNNILTYEELYTSITQIEGILNSRPLLYTSSEEYLTPGHFLIGAAISSYPETNLVEIQNNRLSFWKLCTKIKQDFWKVWSKDYLNQLQNSPKWKHSFPNIKEGDLVLVKEMNTPPLSWPMARIVKTIQGRDGHVRVAEIKIGDKIFTRSIAKLCPLPIN